MPTNTEITIKELLETPAISGMVSIEIFNAVKLTNNLGVTLPVMANTNALSAVGITTTLKMQEQQRYPDAINLQFDEPLNVRVHGPFAQLKFSIDSSAIPNAQSNQLKNKADELKNKINAEKQQMIEAEKK